MPQTKFQRISFGILMSVFMAYGMELYNNSIRAGGMSNNVFIVGGKETTYMWLIVFICSTLFGNKIGQRLAYKYIDPKKDSPFFVTIMISCFTVTIMCPVMSFIATVLFIGFDKEFIANWFGTILKNFPMALLWQLFFAGPIVRFLFGLLFKKQLTNVEGIK